jgi:hypothetical protein
MGKKLTKKETLGMILAEVTKLRGDVKALEKQLSERSKPAVKKPAAKKKAAPKSASVAKKPGSPRRPVLVQADTPSPQTRSAG